ncbi:MAG: hypothetical protein V8R75_04260 [Oscillospiraceae bacterium]
MLAVPRRYGRADYLPVIAWGQLAVQANELQVGDAISLEGRVQSRTYHKITDAGAEERVAYEVSMMHLLAPPPSLLSGELISQKEAQDHTCQGRTAPLDCVDMSPANRLLCFNSYF